MAIQVSQTLKQLEKEVKKLGIEDKIVSTGKNGRTMKEDLIIPIREHNLIKRYGSLGNIPEHMNMMLSMKSPMLAVRIDALKEVEQKEIWENPDWGFEEKLNGVRCIVIYDGNQIHLYSRHNSDKDLLPIEFTDKVMFPDSCDLGKLNKSFMIDCELTCDNRNLNTVIGKYGVQTETVLQAVTAIIGSDVSRARIIQKRENVRLVFNSFDCMFYDGKWLDKEPLKVRKEALKDIFNTLKACGFNIRENLYTNVNKKEMYNNLVKLGKEGCVAKNINGIYIPDSTRGFKGWVKIKRSVSKAESNDDDLGDTFDGWISGFVPGNKGSAFENLVGAVCVSIYKKKSDGTREVHEIARISGMDLRLRQDMTKIVGGQVTLNPKYYDRVVEIDGQGVSARELRLNHAVLIGFRYDKNKDSCEVDEDFLVRNIV